MRRLVVLAVVLLAALAAPLPPAVADDGSLLIDVPGDSAGFTHDPDAPLLQVDRLAPGSTRTATLAVRSTSADAARLVLSVFDVTDAENGCLPAETRAAGEECDADGGELSGWLAATVERDDPSATTLWSGDFAALRDGVELTDSLPPGATWPLRVTLSLSQQATNDTMSDTVSFGTRLAAESEHGSSAVSGPLSSVTGGSPGGSSVLGPLAAGPRVELPLASGTVSLRILLLDAAVLLVGALLLVLLGSRRRQRRHERSRARRTVRRASSSSSPSARTFSTNP